MFYRVLCEKEYIKSLVWGRAHLSTPLIYCCSINCIPEYFNFNIKDQNSIVVICHR